VPITAGRQEAVMGISVSPNGGTLYAAVRSERAVIAINTASLRVTATYPLPADDYPWDVAVQRGRVWVSYDVGTGPSWHAGIGDIDPSMARPVFKNQPAMGGWYSAPEIAADPRNSGVLVAASGSSTHCSWWSSLRLAAATTGPVSMTMTCCWLPCPSRHRGRLSWHGCPGQAHRRRWRSSGTGDVEHRQALGSPTGAASRRRPGAVRPVPRRSACVLPRVRS
jgi:hypothetical protein